MELDTATVLVLLAAGFLAGFVDSIAGGGGLIGISALLLVGASPVEAIGTNKVQALAGAAVSAASYTRASLVDRASLGRETALPFGAAMLGAWTATRLSTGLLEVAVPGALVAVAVFFALKPNIGDLDRPVRPGARPLVMSMIPVIGYYDGLLGPGTGSFFMLVFVGLAGMGVLRATARTKVLNLASNLGAFVVFSVSGVMVWRAGLVMGLAQIGGAALGSRLAIANGARLIKPLLVVTCVAVALRQVLS